MPTNVLQKNQSYPELGYRIDGRGIAYDIATGQSLSRQDVDARIATLEDADPTTDDYAARDRHRGGVAGVYDRNKKYINPAMELGLGLIPGIGPMLAAGYGAATGFDREGQGGIGYDVKKGALGAASGYGLGKICGMGGKALGFGSGAGGAAGAVAGAAPELGAVGSGASNVANAAAGGGGGGIVSSLGRAAASLKPGGKAGLTAADWLKGITGGVSAGLQYKQGQSNAQEDKNRYARDTGNREAQVAANAQNLLNRAPMADNAQYLLRARMGAAPTTFAPRDFTKGPMTAETMAAPAMGGPQTQMAAGQVAAGAYTSGAGGVDTSVLEMLKKRMLANSGMRTA